MEWFTNKTSKLQAKRLIDAVLVISPTLGLYLRRKASICGGKTIKRVFLKRNDKTNARVHIGERVAKCAGFATRNNDNETRSYDALLN